MTDWAAVANVAIAFILFAGVVAAASVYIRSAIRRESAEELEELADTRGKVIGDLEKKVLLLEKQVMNQQGQIDMLRALKTQEIIDGVVSGIAKHPAFNP